ncbi:hypothetical protein HIM_03262 [Hirsutella minnesotensis 3608]|nr:hypothetical protein HIM_03262 [Hirsutella minnesotensis 3608]
MFEVTPLEWTTVQTTIPAVPLPPMASRPEVRTERLILRPLRASDLPAWRAMVSEGAMASMTPQAKETRDDAWYQDRMQKKLAPEGDAKYEFAICLAATSEVIGTGGCHKLAGDFGWPILGYGLRREFWGLGYATEFLRAYLEAWWALPRAQVGLRVERSTLPADAAGDSVGECFMAVTLFDNKGSQNVLTKCGFEFVKVWEETDLLDPEKMAKLHSFVSRKPESIADSLPSQEV